MTLKAKLQAASAGLAAALHQAMHMHDSRVSCVFGCAAEETTLSFLLPSVQTCFSFAKMDVNVQLGA